MTSGKFWTRNAVAAKLTASDVVEIRKRYATGRVTQGFLAREYGISVIQIGRIVRGESWTNVLQTEPDVDEQAEILQRLMKVQEEVNNPRDRMAEDVARLREKEKEGDKMLGELIDQPEEKGK